MFAFFRKKKSVKNQNDRELIEVNSNHIDTLIVLASDEAMKNELKELKEVIKYIIPLAGDKAHSYDKKISELIGDLKIELTKDKDDEKSAAKIANLVRDLKVAVSERKALIR